jgi:RNA polymerase primary sigma factor
MTKNSDLLCREDEESLAIKIRSGLENLRKTVSALDSSPVADRLKAKLEFWEKRSQEKDKAFAYDLLIKAIRKIVKYRNYDNDHEVVAFHLEDDFRRVEQHKDTMAKANLRLVIKISKFYKPSLCISKLDLIQEGNSGLLRAIYRFDPTKGSRFATYAGWWIRQAMQRAVADQSRIIRWPVHVYETETAINRKRQEKEYWNSTDEEIGNELGMNPDIVQSITLSKENPLSLDAPLTGNGSTPHDDDFLSTIADDQLNAPDQVADRNQLSSIVGEILNSLAPREAGVMKLRYGIDCERDMTLQEVAHRFNISRERVRQIQKNAEIRLQRIFKNQDLRTYLHD